MESVRAGVENSPGPVTWNPSLTQGEFPGKSFWDWNHRSHSSGKESGVPPFKGLGSWHHPQGVHVKNTVKDLIQWKRFGQLNTQARWGWQNLNTDSRDSSVRFLISPLLPSSSPLAPPPLPSSSPLPPPPLPSSSPLATPLFPSSFPVALPPLTSSSPLAPPPLPSSSPLAPPLLPSSSSLLAPPPLPSSSPLAPPLLPSSFPVAPPPLPSSSPLAPPPLTSSSPLAPPLLPSSSSPLAPSPLPSSFPLAPPPFTLPPLAMLPELQGVQQQFAGVKVSFFQWQIQQEEHRLSGLSPEVLRTQDEEGDTFLHLAVAQGRRALAFVLARKMADLGLLDAKEHNGQTALQLGVAANQHLIVEDLIGHGAQINTTDSWGRTPLHVSAEKGFLLTLQSLQMALYGGLSVSVEVFNYEGLTPLHAAVLSHNALAKELRTSFQAGKLLQKKKLLSECVKTLLLMGASYGTKDLKSGRSSLYMAAEEANMELLQLFLDQPSYLAIINTKAFNGNTALHVASCLAGRTAQVAAVKLLMRKGADPGAKNLENETPAQLVPEGPAGDEVQRVLKGKDVCA